MQEVEFLPLREPLFIGSFAPITVKVHKAGRVRFQDLDFLIPEGPSAGTISVCQESDATAGVHQILLLAGTNLGRHELHAVFKGTRKSICSMRFEVTDRWFRQDRGPSVWLGGNQFSRTDERYRTNSAGSVPIAVSVEGHSEIASATLAPQPELRAQAATAVLEPDEEFEDVSGASHSIAQEIRQAALNQPAPSIRRWGAPPWQSPDITVTNARSAVDASYRNLPWPGHENTITARIRNLGVVDAPSVVAEFYAQVYGTGGPEVLLGSDTHNIPAGRTVEFSCPWVPLACEVHRGVIVRIRPGTGADSTDEIMQPNNTARSSYTQLIVGVSPSTREAVPFTVGNPFDVPTLVRLVASQDNPQYRTYLEHQWLRLAPREVRKIKTMFEFIPQLAEHGRMASGGGATDRPNHASIVALIEDPTARGDLVALGGTDAKILAGRATRITRFRIIKRRIHGIVVSVADRWPVPQGKVLIMAHLTREGGQQRRSACLVSELDRMGRFVAELPEEWNELEAYFLYHPGFADCASGVITR